MWKICNKNYSWHFKLALVLLIFFCLGRLFESRFEFDFNPTKMIQLQPKKLSIPSSSKLVTMPLSSSKINKLVEEEYWQLLEIPNGTFRLYNAYYDTRDCLGGNSMVRISSFAKIVRPIAKTFCQLRFDEVEETVIVPTEYRVMWSEDSKLTQPYLISCRNPFDNLGFIPKSVSLVEYEFDNPTNNFEVIYNLPENDQKKKFAICVKEMRFKNDTRTMMKLIEWVELVSLLGAHKAYIYVLEAPSNIRKVLKYFESQGKVKIEWISRVKGVVEKKKSLQQFFQNDMLSLNDCLFKHMYEYEYLIPLDVDEVIIPSREEDRTWDDLMGRIYEDGVDSFVSQNYYFLTNNNHADEIQPEVPRNMHLLQHIYRSKAYNYQCKSFQKTKRILLMHNHKALTCLDPGTKSTVRCVEKRLNLTDSRLQHYRDDCDVPETFSKATCLDYMTNTTKDITLWKYKDELIVNFQKTMKDLETFEEE